MSRLVQQRFLAIAGGVACVVAVCGCGKAAHSAGSGAHAPAGSFSGQFQAMGYLAADGNPEPAADSFPDGGERALHYSMCTPGGGKCTPLTWTNKRRTPGPQPGPQPAGTVFKLTATWQRHTYSSSLRWGGALRVTTPPTLTGAMRVGATVRVDGARWSGGWGAASDDLGIEACRTVRATGCVMLAGEYLQCWPTGCGVLGGVPGTVVAPDHAQVGTWYTAWYLLFALDAHLNARRHKLGDVGYAPGGDSAMADQPHRGALAAIRPCQRSPGSEGCHLVARASAWQGIRPRCDHPLRLVLPGIDLCGGPACERSGPNPVDRKRANQGQQDDRCVGSASTGAGDRDRPGWQRALRQGPLSDWLGGRERQLV